MFSHLATQSTPIIPHCSDLRSPSRSVKKTQHSFN
ncbi:hypothetical protein SLEP1_g8995 [Rubroshorea leprosula]|uniref:Uncharacterized protein n=1 Tax=Rubroshorea leprosula TaxID=152421 RepID=A0AAV5IEI3_9ROSI|nr:hypothetical protein SLEP1_g8995 [Rubroshorea leprosula]